MIRAFKWAPEVSLTPSGSKMASCQSLKFEKRVCLSKDFLHHLEERAILTKPHYCAFEDNIAKARKKLSNAEENEQLKIDFMLYCGNSYGLVACILVNGCNPLQKSWNLTVTKRKPGRGGSKKKPGYNPCF